MAQYDDLPIRRITAVSLISIAVTVVTILAVQVLYFGMYGYVSRGRTATTSTSEAVEILSSQTQSINQYGVNEEDGRLVIPIEQAIKKVVRNSAESNETNAETTDGT